MAKLNLKLDLVSLLSNMGDTYAYLVCIPRREGGVTVRDAYLCREDAEAVVKAQNDLQKQKGTSLDKAVVIERKLHKTGWRPKGYE